jgi:hypothetical protein
VSPTPQSEISVTSKDSLIREISVAAYTVPTDFPESDVRIRYRNATASAELRLPGAREGPGKCEWHSWTLPDGASGECCAWPL